MTPAAPLGTSADMSTTIGERIAELREKLGLTHQVIADRGGLARQDVGRVESGERKASTIRVRAGLARGLGLSDQDFSAFLDGMIDVDDAASRAVYAGPHIVRDHAPPVAIQDDDTPLEAALIQALGAGRHKSSDYDAARAAVRYVSHMLDPDADLLDLATGYLDAARWLREHGQRTGPQDVAARFGVARAKVRPEVERQLTEDYTAMAAKAAAEWKPDPDWLAKAKAQSGETPDPFEGTTPTTPVLPPTKSGKRGK